MTLYRIAWRDMHTGDLGHMDGQFPRQDALFFADKFNLKYAGKLTHWIEPVPTAAVTETPDDKESTDN